ncbi:hypothetical protein EJP69_02890 [Variovorax gossypii]|uniref:SseB protein N-terminal domain-containing protein n=1 Tax=Variovorax gossypii TaxID=1679495 RepID=A0A431TRH1_9BURK|nr:SseB family protein [Variovorax gossypii]RTQ36704.1 hypothetical protein EJP69_02890 [Variovorax gossypii]
MKMGIFSLFSGAKVASKLNLEELIYNVAEFQRDEDFQDLYRRMENSEVFVPVVQSSLPLDVKPGQRITTDSSVSIRMHTVRAPDGQSLIPCATQQDSPILKSGYVGMRWVGFLEMSLKVDPPPYGVLLQGQRSWVAFDLARVRHILKVTSRK